MSSCLFSFSFIGHIIECMFLNFLATFLLLTNTALYEKESKTRMCFFLRTYTFVLQHQPWEYVCSIFLVFSVYCFYTFYPTNIQVVDFRGYVSKTQLFIVFNEVLSITRQSNTGVIKDPFGQTHINYLLSRSLYSLKNCFVLRYFETYERKDRYLWKYRKCGSTYWIKKLSFRFLKSQTGNKINRSHVCRVLTSSGKSYGAGWNKGARRSRREALKRWSWF